MLRTSAPFPQVGSYALTQHEGRSHLARIVARNPDGSVVVSLPQRIGAGGNFAIPISELQDGSPLTPVERADYNALEDRFITKPEKPRSAKARGEWERWQALRLRTIANRVLERMLDEHLRRIQLREVA